MRCRKQHRQPHIFHAAFPPEQSRRNRWDSGTAKAAIISPSSFAHLAPLCGSFIAKKEFFFLFYFYFFLPLILKAAKRIIGVWKVQQLSSNLSPCRTSDALYNSKESYNYFLVTWTMIYLVATWKKISLICLVVTLIFFACVGVGVLLFFPSCSCSEYFMSQIKERFSFQMPWGKAVHSVILWLLVILTFKTISLMRKRMLVCWCP